MLVIGNEATTIRSNLPYTHTHTQFNVGGGWNYCMTQLDVVLVDGNQKDCRLIGEYKPWGLSEVMSEVAQLSRPSQAKQQTTTNASSKTAVVKRCTAL
jgi:hypothetical protein